MTVTQILEASKSLVFAQIVKVHRAQDAPWAIGHILDLEHMQPLVPPQSVFLNVSVLRTQYQMYRVGPFCTPYNVDLAAYGLPKEGDIVVGKTGVGKKGAVFTTWLPDQWARPMGYFFHYLSNTAQAMRLYESQETALRMVLLGRLSVEYPLQGEGYPLQGEGRHSHEGYPLQGEGRHSHEGYPLQETRVLHDERLYDLLLLILFDDFECLLNMCRTPDFRPGGQRTWDLTSQDQRTHIYAVCAAYASDPDVRKPIYIPSVSEFIEETALFIQDVNACGHFRATLKVHVEESPSAFQAVAKTWLEDAECMNATFLQGILDMN